MNVDGGAVLDSRQLLEGDPKAYVAHQALTTTPLWWTTVVSLAMPLLESSTAGGFALVIGKQMLRELRSDGTLASRRLTALLPGGCAKIPGEVISGRLHLAPGYESRGPVGPDPAKPGMRWSIIPHDFGDSSEGEGSLGAIASQVAARVIVDVSTYPYMWNHRAKVAFSSFERGRQYADDVVLIVPHTPAVEAYLGGYVDWVASGRKGPGPYGASHDTDLSIEERQLLLKTIPVPLHADFKVTGLIERGEWRDPADLEAARSLLQTRFDLKIGIWDLVGNPTLRQTLLDSAPITPAPNAPTELPKMAVNRAKRKVDDKAQEVVNRTNAKAAISARLAPHGWLHETGITYRLKVWRGRLEDAVLLYLTLSITRRRCAITIACPRRQDELVRRYLLAHCDALDVITGLTQCQIREGETTLWECGGGWADDVDWDKRATEIVEFTRQWAELFEELGEQCTRAELVHEGERIANLEKMGFEVGHWGGTL